MYALVYIINAFVTLIDKCILIFVDVKLHIIEREKPQQSQRINCVCTLTSLAVSFLSQ